MRRMVTVLLAAAIGLQGCAVAALVGASAFAAKADKDSKLEFERLNLDREKAGLEPLNWSEYKEGREAKPDQTLAKD